MLDPKPVRMCVCTGLTFEEINRRGFSTLDQIAHHTGAGDGCKSCLPYLRLMLQTGDTRFPVISWDEPCDKTP